MYVLIHSHTMYVDHHLIGKLQMFLLLLLDCLLERLKYFLNPLVRLLEQEKILH